MPFTGLTNRISQVWGGGRPIQDLRVEVIGIDGIRRYAYCSRQDTMAFDKYRIDPEGVFLTEYHDEKGNVLYEPTILFYENSTECVREGERSNPTPEEAGEAISQAAFSLARLMKSKDDEKERLMLYLTVGTLLAALGALYMAFRGSGDISTVLEMLKTGASSVAPPITPAPTPIKV
jgi:hypothetical protein